MTVSSRLSKLIQAFEARSLKIERRNNYVQAQCPCHDDSSPSVSFRENSDGKISIKCHAGCDGGNILKELGLNYEILYPENEKKKSFSKRSIVATYPYLDEEGTVVYESVRYHPKDFRQRVPLSNGKFQWSLKNVRRVIYNLPNVIKAIESNKPVFLVEGEEDADNLNDRRLVGTTVPMGAGKWQDDYTPYFKDAAVVILPDNDEPGKKHAVLVAEKLLGLAKSVRIVMLPDIPEKGDVTDWLMNGGTADELLKLAFDEEPISDVKEAQIVTGIDDNDEQEELEESDTSDYAGRYFEKDCKIYHRYSELLIADFAIDIVSVVHDDNGGRKFYIKIREIEKGVLHVTEKIEIIPEHLDNLTLFYKAIRPFSMGEIYQYKDFKTRPISIFKWLLLSFNKPVVRRPDHVGRIYSMNRDNRPFWMFGNAMICPEYTDKSGVKHKAKLILPNENSEFIVDDRTGFTLPLYESELEKEQLVPLINTDIGSMDNAAQFAGEVRSKLVDLIGGGNPMAMNFAKYLLGFVAYHLYEKELNYANDINGHSVMLYVFGPKGTGKTTYFNTILRAFFGLHKTKELKGNTVTVAAIENQMGHFSNLPVCYDEFNPEVAKIDYQAINGYYHKVSRTVSDMDRKGRNKFTPIRSTLSITSNFKINLDVDQADTTESRVIYFEYKKEYRSNNAELFEWFQENLDKISRVTTYMLLNQTSTGRNTIKNEVQDLYKKYKAAIERDFERNPGLYTVEHRLTDNYSRIVACYEHCYGIDNELRAFTLKHLLDRFAAAKINEKEQRVIDQVIYMAAGGKIKEYWHYAYLDSKKELTINLKSLYGAYEEEKREKAVDYNTFKKTFEEYFETLGPFNPSEVCKWNGSYYTKEGKIYVNKSVRVVSISFDLVKKENSRLRDLFPIPNDLWNELKIHGDNSTIELPTDAGIFGDESPVF